MKAINIHEAKIILSRIVEEVAAGEEIIVAKTKPPPPLSGSGVLD